MASVGDCWDNALCDSFSATAECELLDRCRCDTQTQARIALFDHTERWYDRHRRHSELG